MIVIATMTLLNQHLAIPWEPFRTLAVKERLDFEQAPIVLLLVKLAMLMLLELTISTAYPFSQWLEPLVQQ